MAKPAVDEDRFIELWRRYGGAKALARHLGVTERAVLSRRRSIEERRGITLSVPRAAAEQPADAGPAPVTAVPDVEVRSLRAQLAAMQRDQLSADFVIGALGPIIRGDHKKRSRASQIDMGYDVLMIGHFHQLIQQQRLIVNGSLKGYDEYAYSNNFGFERARQALWITHPEHGITFNMAVNVDERTEQVSYDWVSLPQ